MSGKKTSTSTAKTTTGSFFEKQNLQLMLIGGVVIAIGMVLMVGGKSPDPNVFLKEEVYSFRRITLAPLLILLGLVIEIYAIFKKSKTSK